MGYALRYYKDIPQKDGGVVRLEIYKKDSTASAIEIGAVVRALSLEIQGQQGDVDTPIVKTSLSMTFVDAQDIQNDKKNGFWQEFYTPDSVLWRVVLKAKDEGATSFRTIWGGYVTPDSFSESLVYRGDVTIIARDNIGHMQDFPFDAEGDADGMISLYDLVSMAWSKIQSPMDLLWFGEHWLETDSNTIAYNTLMNVSAFEGMNWYDAVEKALYSYGGVLRYVGGNEVLVTTLRYMPTYGGNIDRLPRIEPKFIAGAQRELVPAVKRIEESASYDLVENDSMPQIKVSDFSGSTETYRCKIDGVDSGNGSFGTLEHDAPIWSINNTELWSNEDGKSLFFNPHAYDIGYFSERRGLTDELLRYMYIAANNVDERAVSFRRNITCADLAIRIKFGQPISLNSSMKIEQQTIFNLKKIRYSVSLIQNGITNYLAGHGGWVVDKQEIEKEFDATAQTFDFECVMGMGEYVGHAELVFTIHKIEYAQTSFASLAEYGLYACVQDFAIGTPTSLSLLEKNTVNTNYQDENNVILNRDPELAPAFNTVALPAFIKNGIFYRSGDSVLPARSWGWSGGSKQQMAVWNHLQLLSYYAKPNNLLSGTIVNADVTRVAVIYDWHRAEHILVSGRFNFLTGHIESAVLREFARYEDMWSEVAGADMPATEQNSRSNVEGGASASSSSSTYTATQNVNIGTGGGTGASNLNDLLDVDTSNVVAQSVLYYNGAEWVDMSFATLVNPYLNPYLKADVAENTYAKKTDLSVLSDAINDNAGNIKKNFDAIEALTTRVKAEEDITATYKPWWDDLKDLIVKDGNNVKINANLVVAGDTTSEGTGTDVGPSGIIGIKVNGHTYYDKDDGVVDGIINLSEAFNNITIDTSTLQPLITETNKLPYSLISGTPTIPSLDGYATESWVRNNYVATSDMSEYASKDWVNEKGYITGITLSGDDFISVNGYNLSLALDAQGGLTNTGQGLGVAYLRNALTINGQRFDGSAAVNITISGGGGEIGTLTSQMVIDALGYTPLSKGGGTMTGDITLDNAWLQIYKGSVQCGYNASGSDYEPLYMKNGSWVNLIHSGNIGSQTVATANKVVSSLGYELLDVNSDGLLFLGGRTATWTTVIDGTSIHLCTKNYAYGLMVADNGNVLIGTTTDSGEKLQVAGPTYLESNTYSQHCSNSGPFKIKTTSAVEGNRVIEVVAPNITKGNGILMYMGVAESKYNGGYFRYRYDGLGSSSNAIQFGFWGADDLVTILGSGNVGIRTPNPQAPLHVHGTTRIQRLDDARSYLDITSDDVSVYYNGYDSDGWCNHHFQSNGVTRMTIYGISGDVAISNSLSVGNILSIGDSNTSSSIINRLCLSNAGGTKGAGAAIIFGYDKTMYHAKIAGVYESQSPDYLRPALAFYTMGDSYLAGSEVERMRIASNGNILMGTTTDSGGKLQVGGKLLLSDWDSNGVAIRLQNVYKGSGLISTYTYDGNAYSFGQETTNFIINHNVGGNVFVLNGSAKQVTVNGNLVIAGDISA